MEELKKKFSKLGTDALLKKLNGQKLSIEEITVVKDIIAARDAKVQKMASVKTDDRVSDAVEKYDLDWRIEHKPLHVAIDTDSMSMSKPHAKWLFPYRTDTNEPIGRNIASTKKPILQNDELLDLAFRLAGETGGNVSTVKTWGQGSSIMIGLEATETFKIGPDEVAKNIYLLDNRTGEHGLLLGFGDTVLRCQNQMNMVRSNRAITMRHTVHFREKLEELVQAYEKMNDKFLDHKTNYDMLASTSVTDEEIEAFVEHLLGSSVEEKRGRRGAKSGLDFGVQLEKAITNQIMELGGTAKQTKWGLLNGVTLITTHQQELFYPRTSFINEAQNMVEGKVAEFAQKAYDYLVYE